MTNLEINLDMPIIIGDNCGFADSHTKNAILKPNIHYFKEGFNDGFLSFTKVTKIKNRAKYIDGYINEKGKTFNMIGFDSVSSFSKGLARVKKDNKVGFIDKTLQLSIDFNFKDCGCFSENYLSSASSDGLLYGYIKTSGEYEINPQYYIAYDFHEDLAVVLNKNNNFEVINANDETIFNIPGIFKTNSRFSDGKLLFHDNMYKYGFLDKKGNFSIYNEFNYIAPLSEGLAITKDINDLYGFIDFNGDTVINNQYILCHSFYNGLSRALIKTINGNLRWGYINQKNEPVTPFIFDECDDFIYEYARVRVGDEIFYIDKNGDRVLFNYIK